MLRFSIASALVLIFTLVGVGCSKESKVAKTDSVELVRFVEQAIDVVRFYEGVSGEWDKVCFIKPYTSIKSLENIIASPDKYIIPSDDSEFAIFFLKKKIVEKYYLLNENFDFKVDFKKVEQIMCKNKEKSIFVVSQDEILTAIHE